jgi:putative DNA primase/helicase
VAILAITHLNKAPAQVLYRVMGSLAFVALARATWFVVKDPANPRRRLLMPNKNNVAADNGPGLAYCIQEDDQGRATIAWEPDPVTQSLEEVLVEVKEDSPKAAEAKAFIQAYIADGHQHLSTNIKEAALADGIAQKTYERAQADEIKGKRVELVIGELKRRYLKKPKEKEIKK